MLCRGIPWSAVGAVAACVSCYDAQKQRGATATDAAARADSTTPEDPGDASITADSDRDGIVDASDNCIKITNSRQHDEDRDGIGDECDGCPISADANQSDSDGDGVTGICDQYPGKEHILWFQGFGAELPSMFIKSRGAWNVSGDQLNGQAPGDNGAILSFDVGLTDSSTTTVMFAATVKALDAQSRQQMLMGMTGYDSNNSSSKTGCGATPKVAFTPPAPFSVGRFSSYTQFDPTDTAPTAPTLVVGDTVVTKMKLGPSGQGNHGCVIDTGNGFATLTNSNALPPTSPLGLRLDGMTASYDWLMMIVRD